MARHLSKQESTFAEHYALTKNGRQSAILAGYSETNASGAAHRLLKRSRVLTEVKRLETIVFSQSSITREQLEAFYLKIMADSSAATITEKLKASELLSKLKGWHRRDIDLLLAMDAHELSQYVERAKKTLNVPYQIESNGK